MEVEALIESEPPRWTKGDEHKLDDSEPVKFDWQLHSYSLEGGQQLARCSSDDLGPKTADKLSELLPEDRSIVLDKLNRWSIRLNESVRDVGAMIWGRSISLRLAESHTKLAGLETKRTPSVGGKQTAANMAGNQTKAEPKPSARPALARPQLAASVAPSVSTQAPGKPTFAPRPRPNISGRFSTKSPAVANSSSPARIKRSPQGSPPIEVGASTVPQTAAKLDQKELIKTVTANSTTSDPSVEAKEKAEATKTIHRRIVKQFGSLVMCANIVDVREVKTVQATFESNLIGGSVTLRGNEDQLTLIYVNLYHIRSKVATRHDWRIMATDILDQRRSEDKCKQLQLVFDGSGASADGQQAGGGSLRRSGSAPAEGRQTAAKPRVGELGRRLGQIQVAGQGRGARAQLVDTQLSLASLLESPRALFVAIYEPAKSGQGGGNGSSTTARAPAVLGCAQVGPLAARRLEASVNMEGVRGSVQLSQRYLGEPTSVAYDLYGLEGNVNSVALYELPVAVGTAGRRRACGELGRVLGGQHLGNLSVRHGPLAALDSEYEDHYVGEWLDLGLQLFGVQTPAGRSLAIAKNSAPLEPWVCATLEPVGAEGLPLAVGRARAQFHFPLVGDVWFWQTASEASAPTGVLVELYQPGGEQQQQADSEQQKASGGWPKHQWQIHSAPTQGDFYNWSQRCQSAGDPFDPSQSAVGLNGEAYARQCLAGLANEPLRCRLGDLSLKSGLQLELASLPENRRRLFYVDPYLPLSGPHSIVGRSLVVYDEQAPLQRGPRLACATIRAHHALRAAVKHWHSGPSIPSAVRGLVTMEQQAPGLETRLKLDLQGLNGNVDKFSVHEVWLSDEREFPCSNDSLYDVYDNPSPLHSQTLSGLPPSAHFYTSSTTVDRLKVGELSKKHGSLEGLQTVQRQFGDKNLPLFAPHSVLGRSLVLRAAVNDFRWVCGNLELDYERSGAREIIALASFDEPRSKVAGFVRFFQLEHKDGSLSDTFIQADLRLQQWSGGGPDHAHLAGAGSTAGGPQSNQGHNWAVFVNQVGEDAFIAADEVRCIGAGFKWNPYLAPDQLEAYAGRLCGPLEPQACAVGDLGLRHGPLTLEASSRRALSDSNLPLSGNYSILGRSLVIFDRARPGVKLACANIVPDIHLKSNVVIKQTPSFTVARFIEQMRQLLEATDWLMVPELQATKSVANGECVQMTIHFYGQRAHQMQVELNNLVTLGTVRRSTRNGVEKISTHYRMCRAGQAALAAAGADRRQLLSGGAAGGRVLKIEWAWLVVPFGSALVQLVCGGGWFVAGALVRADLYALGVRVERML